MAAEVQCSLQAPRRVVAGQPVWLKLTLKSPTAMQVLNWGTPFEGGWLAPFVVVDREGQALAYQGAQLKRGDPERADYLALHAGQARHARIDLAQGFDLRQPGHYRVTPHLHLHDVQETDRAMAPRPRSALQAQPLNCPTLTFEVTGAPT